jgi:hypothetical protein
VDRRRPYPRSRGAIVNGLESLAFLAQIVTAFFVAVSLTGSQVRQNARAQQAENYGRALDRVAAMQARLSENVTLSSMFSRAIVDPSRAPVETVASHAEDVVGADVRRPEPGRGSARR